MAVGDGFKIAEAYVDIKAKMDGRAIKREIERGLKEAGLRESGNAAGKEIGDGIKDAIGDKANESGKKIADGVGKGGSDGKKNIEKEMGSIPQFISSVAQRSIDLFNDIFNFRSPILSIAVLGAAIAALPLVASAVGTAIVLAFGAAFASIGVMGALQNEEVKRSFYEAWNDIKAIANTISQPFQRVLKIVADEARNTFAAFAPALSAAFVAMAPHLENFTRGVSSAFLRLVPSIAPLTAAFNVLLDRFSVKLPDLFKSIADMVSNLSNKLQENPGTVDAVVNSFIFLIDTLSNVTGFLMDVTGWIQRNSEAAGNLFVALSALANPAAGFIVNLTGIRDKGSAATGVVESTDRAIAAIIETMARAEGQALTYAESLDEIAKKNLTAEQASLRFDQAILKMSNSIDENGTSLDSNTQKGADNKEALLSMAAAANKAKDTYIEQGMASDVVRDKSVQMRDEMVKQAQKLGMTKDEAQKLIDKYFAVPPKVETKIETPGADTSKNKIDGVKKATDNVPRNVTTRVEAQDNASGTLNRITDLVGSIARQIWVNVTAIFSKDGNIVNFADGAENHVAQIAGAGAMRVWAEPETGGEAYIPLAPSKRPRSEAILSEVADRFGLTLARPMADGGLIDSISRAVGSGGGRGGVTINNMNVSVSLAGVWDFTDPTKAREIANRIAPALREAIRVDERRYA